LAVRFVRSLCFFSIFWLSGLAAIVIDGFVIEALFWLTLCMANFHIIGFMIFAVSGWFSNRWDWFFGWSSHILKLSELEFAKFHDKLERLITSFYPCLTIGLVLAINWLRPEFGAILEFGTLWRVRWYVCYSFMFSLLAATVIWMIVSMWITMFLTFRKPLDLKLSRWTSRDFRPLALWSLKISLLSFGGLTIYAVFITAIQFAFVADLWQTHLVLSTVFFAFVAVTAFLLPFYNIHRTLVKLKKRELQEIEAEYSKLTQELNENLSKHPTKDSKERLMLITPCLINLQIRERIASEADEWPIDTTILSMLTLIVLIPLLTQIVIDILFGIFRI